VVKQHIVGFIFARGGSKGVPRKNIRLLAGKPLIAYAIEAGRQCRQIDRVIVSTDDEEIAAVSKEFGAEVPFLRPKELAQDTSPEIFAWRHAIEFLESGLNGRKVDLFVSIPPTAPLRISDDIDKCISCFQENDVDIVVTVKNAARHPSFNMVRFDEQGYSKLVMPQDASIVRRQDAPPVYDMATVAYVARPQFVMQAKSIFDGKVKSVIIPDDRAIDIDTELDFQFAEFLLTKRAD
jgi:CMP-N-acetylneuraminic acid synthetase